MSSILTNNGAMVALQTLKSINRNLGMVQSEISTGKSVASAKDNAAVWAISKVMESDVDGFEAISSSLNLGSASVAVASSASEQVTDLLQKVKEKVISAQEENVDRGKIQTDIEELRNQIVSVVGAAQFNGLNLVSNGSIEAGSGTVNILSSLDRASDGTVTANHIEIKKQDLRTDQQELGTTAVGTLADYITGTAAAVTGASTPAARTLTIENGTVEAGIGYRITLSAPAGSATVGSGNGGAGVYEYVARDGDTARDVAQALANEINSSGAEAVSITTGAPAANGDTGFTFDFDTAADGVTLAFAAFTSAGATIGGGLADLRDIDVSTSAGAESALTKVETLLQTSIQAASNLGSASGRIEGQSEFIGKLTDSLKSGIGALVDADLEAASARLQALQVQQQLGTQSLSIANQAPQSILSLFR